MRSRLAIALIASSSVACVRAGGPTATLTAVIADAKASSGTAEPPIAPDPSPGCLGSAPVPAPHFTIEVDGLSRRYLVHAPAQTDRPMPLVLNFHGLLESPHGQQILTGMDEAAARRGMLVAYPEGMSWSWNAGSCCGRAFYDHIDDLHFVRALVARLERDYCVDRRRIYATGMSNGGLLSYRLACEAADVFAAVAPVAAVEACEACSPARPVPVLAIHGRADLVVPYNGGAWNFPSVEETIARWERRDGCAEEPMTTVFEHGGARCRAAQGCRNGTDVVLCTVRWGGHTWPGGQFVPWLGYTTSDLNATETILDFFAAHPLR